MQTFPTSQQLAARAPLVAWRHAHQQAMRSPMRNFSVGAVLLDPANGRVLSRGCSHTGPAGMAMASTHAEQHALGRARHVDLTGAVCVTVAVGRAGRMARSARPCPACAFSLDRAGVDRVVFCERTEDVWQVHDIAVADLEARAGCSGYARHLRAVA